MITEIEIEETVKRVVKCEPGYRFLSDEEWEKDDVLCERYDQGSDEWLPAKERCTRTNWFTKERHHFRIKLTPQPFEWKGVMYEKIIP